MNNSFMMYMLESEGELDTKRGKIEKVIKILSKSANPNEYLTQEYAFQKAGLNYEDLTEQDIDYIEREVSKRY